MPNSQRSSHASETCRIECAPSRLLTAALLALGALGASGVLASGMPVAIGVPLALASIVAAMHAAVREARCATRVLIWDGRAGVVRVDGIVVAQPRLDWRGPLACVSWRDARGRRQRLALWPDMLDARQRRELRLAAGPVAATPAPASVAP